MSTSLFSVLIANYNNGRYLQEAIDSVLAQTYTKWEIVLVDDKSTDNSYEIYEKFKDDSRFHIYYNEKNKGCGYTKRRCIDLANGELCGFLDPDDKLSSDALEIMARVNEKQPHCSLAYSTLYLWNDEQDTIKVLENVGAMGNGEDFLISSKKMVSHFAVFKKTFYDKTIGIDETLSSAVDFDLYVKLEEVGSLCFINLPLYYYRQTNPQSISIGNASLRMVAEKNRNKAALEAFCRRIRNRNGLFVNKREKYMYRMRWLLNWCHHNVKGEKGAFLRGCWWYLVGNRFAWQSFNHIRKMFLSNQ